MSQQEQHRMTRRGLDTMTQGKKKNMMNEGGFGLGRLARACRSRLGGWLPLAGVLIVVAMFALSYGARVWAGGATLPTQVSVANSGAILGGSEETFAAGSKPHSKPLFYNAGLAGGAAGIAINPFTLHLFVALNTGNAVLGFSPTATGKVAPEQPIIGPATGLDTPSGVAFDADAGPVSIDSTGEIYVANTLPLICKTTPAASCTGASPDLCAIGSVEIFASDAVSNATPLVTIKGCGTALFGPVGIYAEESTVNLCVASATCPPTAPSAPDPTGAGALCACNKANNLLIPIPTRRIWVVNRFAGFVSIYTPEFDEALGIPGDAQPPVGGFFYTTLDGLAPASAGGKSTDVTEPNYLAVSSVSNSGVPSAAYV
ncbi:MAG: hypothetical protein ACYDC3_04730, partial [Candidatus Binataceae bacterium]